MNLSEHFSLEELVFSDIAIRRGLDNTPTPEIFPLLTLLCQHVLEPLRVAVNQPIHVISGYRSEVTNRAVGGARESQHCMGQAADIHIVGITAIDLWKNIILGEYGEIPYDQIIYELNSWVHISYKPINQQRSIILTSIRELNGKTVYTRYVKAHIKDLKI